MPLQQLWHNCNFLGCALDENLSGETMALKVTSKIKCRLRFLYRKNIFLSQLLRTLLCNPLIQPHFHYACSAWYLNLKSRLQILQNKCIRFCLNLDSKAHIGLDQFEKISWLPINDCSNIVLVQWPLSISITWVLCIWIMYLN